MAQAINELLNINVTKAAGLPDTGFAGPVNNVGDVVENLGIVGCDLIALIVVALLIAIILFFTRRVFTRPNLALVSSLGAFVFALGLAFPAICLIAHAVDTHTTNLNITTGSAPVASTVDTEGITLAAASVTGYKVTAYVDGDGTLANGSSSISLSSRSVADPDSLATNTYAIKNTAGQYIPISNNPANPTEILRVEEDTPAGTPITLTYAAKLDGTLEAGTYAGNIHYSIEPLPITFDMAYDMKGQSRDAASGLYKMQEMTPAICDTVSDATSTAAADTQIGTLVDIRDNKTYTVAKLKDGECWMTQNLALELKHGTSLTAEKTDLNSTASWDPASDTGGWAYSSTAPYSIIPTGAPDGSGVYYNWTAAVASNNTTGVSGTMPDSICPKGWQLPIMDGTTSTSTNQPAKLFINYGWDSGTHKMPASTVLTDSPLSLAFTGTLTTPSSEVSDTTYGQLWSSVALASDKAYATSFKLDNTVHPDNSQNRGDGQSVRCVVRRP